MLTFPAARALTESGAKAKVCKQKSRVPRRRRVGCQGAGRADGCCPNKSVGASPTLASARFVSPHLRAAHVARHRAVHCRR
eukprot:6180220-Pleurochrysis_carterae.AAC.1